MQDDEAAIRQLVSTWISASREGDHATVLSLMADDVVFLLPGQPPMRGRAAYAAAAQGGGKPWRLEFSSHIEEIQVLGDWAWLWTRLSVQVTPQEGMAPLCRAGSTLSILQKQAGRWVIVRDANMLAEVTG